MCWTQRRPARTVHLNEVDVPNRGTQKETHLAQIAARLRHQTLINDGQPFTERSSMLLIL